MKDYRGKKIAMIFQEPNTSLNPVISIGQQISETIKLHLNLAKSQARNHAIKMLEQVGIPDAKSSMDLYPHQLSGGMQQRVGLARALAVEPEILLLDEPFSGLDPLIRRQMRSELAVLQKEIQKTMVFITHDLDEAVTVGDRIAIMRDGEIIQMGTPEEIILNPVDDFVAEFTEDVSKDRVLNASSISVTPDLIWSYSHDLNSLKNKMDEVKAGHIAFVNESGASLCVLM